MWIKRAVWSSRTGCRRRIYPLLHCSVINQSASSTPHTHYILHYVTLLCQKLVCFTQTTHALHMKSYSFVIIYCSSHVLLIHHIPIRYSQQLYTSPLSASEWVIVSGQRSLELASLFSLVPPIKVLCSEKLIQARLGVSRTIQVNVDSD